jgi:hypothetical protein
MATMATGLGHSWPRGWQCQSLNGQRDLPIWSMMRSNQQRYRTLCDSPKEGWRWQGWRVVQWEPHRLDMGRYLTLQVLDESGISGLLATQINIWKFKLTNSLTNSKTSSQADGVAGKLGHSSRALSPLKSTHWRGEGESSHRP